MSKYNFKKVATQIEIALGHESSPVNLLRIFKTPFPENTSGRLRLSLLNTNTDTTLDE